MHCELKKKLLKYVMLIYSCRPINYTSHRTLLINGIRTKNILDNFTFTITSDLEMYFFKEHCTSNKHPPYVRCMKRYSIGRQTDGLTRVAISSSQGVRPFYQFLYSLRIMLQKLPIITHPNCIPE